MVRALRLQNVRAHKDYFIEFDKGVNVIVGPNASGKTTIIEALYLCLRGKSFKGSVRELMRSGSEWMRVDLDPKSNKDYVVKVKLNSFDKIDKEFISDGKSSKRLPSSLKLPVVLFEPDDLRLVSGSPQRRRGYVDGLISSINSEHSSDLNKYKKALQQRNRLLKNNAPVDDFFVWNVQLSSYGEKIIKRRKQVISELSGSIENTYQKISAKKDSVSVEYVCVEKDLMAQLNHSLGKDLVVGATSCGPHKDDVRIVMNEKDAKKVASRGETRSLVLALKHFEFEYLKDFYGEPPLLLLDDVFSELDGQRRRSLTDLMQSTQTIITTTDADLALSIDPKTSVRPLVGGS